jgi:MFS transporter, DHA1 family, multidrug resistance protein
MSVSTESGIVSSAARPPAKPRLALLVAVTASGTLAMHMFVPALPLAARDLAVSQGAIQLTITLYLVGLAAGQLLYGPISDRFGRRPVLMAALTLFALASIAAWMAPDLKTLIVARVLQALGGCGGLVLGRAIVRDVSEAHEAAAQLALLNLVMVVAPGVAPFVGGYAAIALGWRAVFGLLAAIGTMTLLAAALTLPETARSRARGYGQVLRSYPRLLRSASVRGYVLGGACMTTSIYAFLSASPFIFTEVLHRPTEEVGFYYLIIFSGFSVGSIVVNRMIRRVPQAHLLRGASLVAGFGAAALFVSAITGHLTLIVTVASVLLFTIGAGVASPLALTGAVSVRQDAIGAAAGLYGFTQMSIGALCTLIVSLWHDNPAISSASVLLTAAVIGIGSLAAATKGSAAAPR